MTPYLLTLPIILILYFAWRNERDRADALAAEKLCLRAELKQANSEVTRKRKLHARLMGDMARVEEANAAADLRRLSVLQRWGQRKNNHRQLVSWQMRRMV